METVTLSVLGMSCGHCKKAIIDELMGVGGVKSVDVSLEDKRVTISYDEATVGLDKLKEMIVETGYEVQ